MLKLTQLHVHIGTVISARVNVCEGGGGGGGSRMGDMGEAN